MTDLLQVIRSRASTPRLTTPAPSRQEMEEALACAQKAPDHGRLRPWRFYVLEGEALNALGELFVEAARHKSGTVEDNQAERLRSMPLRAPLLVVAAAKVLTEHKIPVWEQYVAVGAAVQNLQLALHSMGYACMWRTGEMASDPLVKARFGLGEADQIVGFLYVGTMAEAPKPAEPESAERVFFGMP